MGLGFLLRFYLLQIPVTANAARRKLKEEGPEMVPVPVKQGMWSAPFLLPLGEREGKGKAVLQKTSMIFV